MKSKKWFCGILAAAFAFSLAGADIASAYCGGGACGRGQGGGQGSCYTKVANGARDASSACVPTIAPTLKPAPLRQPNRLRPLLTNYHPTAII
jgi:hypothetical protein